MDRATFHSWDKGGQLHYWRGLMRQDGSEVEGWELEIAVMRCLSDAEADEMLGRRVNG